MSTQQLLPVINTVNYTSQKQDRQTGRHYRISAASPSLGMDQSIQPYVDRSEMSARAVISTATVDRVGDLLVPQGCRLTNYEKNPVVLWAHGMEGITQPIGTSRSPDGHLAVTITETEIQATSWFSQSSLEATQIFELIDEGIVRATSVRETPLKFRIQRDSSGNEILVVEEWDLEEWSWCAIGINPDAVAKTLNRNRLGGQPIVPSILKSLIEIAPVKSPRGLGILMENSMSPEKSADTVTEEQVADSLPDLDEFDDNPETHPYGSSVVSATYAALAATCQNIDDAMAPLENPAVKEGMSAILSALQGQLTALEGLHATTYPDLPVLHLDVQDDQDTEAFKAFLASGRTAALQVSGLGSRLKGLVGARNLTSEQRRTVNEVVKQMSRLANHAKSQRADSDDSKLLALQQSIDELKRLCSGIK